MHALTVQTQTQKAVMDVAFRFISQHPKIETNSRVEGLRCSIDAHCERICSHHCEVSACRALTLENAPVSTDR